MTQKIHDLNVGCVIAGAGGSTSRSVWGDGFVALHMRLSVGALLAHTRPWVPSSSLKTEGMEEARGEWGRGDGARVGRRRRIVVPTAAKGRGCSMPDHKGNSWGG